MKAPSIYSAVTFSFFLHIIAFTLSFFIARELYTRKPITPYVVSLVSPNEGANSGGHAEEHSAPAPETKTIAPEVTRPVAKPPVESHTKRTTLKEEAVSVKDRIAELEAKRKIERMLALRKIVDIGASRRPQTSNRVSSRESGQGNGGSAAGGGDYYSLVYNKIRQQWIYPDTLDKDLETIISIKIAKDGGVTIEGIEKSSGSPLFDRTAIRAITQASPLPPPYKELEMGLRFKPHEKD